MNLEAWQEALVSLRHHLHQHPELSGEEHQTQAYLREWLRAHDIEATPILGTGLIVELQGASSSDRYTLLRADIDALPVHETTECSFASGAEGVMHACGHDTHTAMLAVALVILQAHRSEWSGRVRAIFQPAEELNSHTHHLREEGVITDDLTGCFALHVLPTLPLGSYHAEEGPVMAGSERFEIELKGPGGHGGQPHQGVDGVLCAATLVQAIQTIVARRMDPQAMAVISIGTMQVGSSWNVLAQEAKLIGNLRFYEDEVRERMEEELRHWTTDVATSFGMTSSLSFQNHLPPVVNEPERVLELRERLEPSRKLQFHPMRPLTVSEDFGRYLEQIPGVMGFLGVETKDDARSAKPLHHPSFLPPDEALMNGVRMHLAAAGLVRE